MNTTDNAAVRQVEEASRRGVAFAFGPIGPPPEYEDQYWAAGNRDLDGTWLADFIKKSQNAISIIGARITSDIVLSDARVDVPIELIGCQLGAHRLVLSDATLQRLDLLHTHAAEVVGTHAVFNGAIRLANCVLGGGKGAALHLPCLTARNDILAQGLRTTGVVDLIQAHVEGQVSLSGAQLDAGSSSQALNLAEATVGKSVFLDRGFSAQGLLNLLNLRVAGQLSLRGASLGAPRGTSLLGSRMTVTGSVFLDDGFTASGGVDLKGMTVGGMLSLTGATFTSTDSDALVLDAATISEVAGSPMSVTGELGMVRTHVLGSVSLAGASLSNAGGHALRADELRVGGSISLNDGFRALGVTRISGARVGGSVVLTDADLRSEDVALAAEGLAVDGSISLSGSFRTLGQIRLTGSSIGGQLDCAGAALSNLQGQALVADQCDVAGGVFINEGFRSQGEVSLRGARNSRTGRLSRRKPIASEWKVDRPRFR